MEAKQKNAAEELNGEIIESLKKANSVPLYGEYAKELLMRLGQLHDYYTHRELTNNMDELMGRKCDHCGSHQLEWGYTCPSMVWENKEKTVLGDGDEVYCSDNCKIQATT